MIIEKCKENMKQRSIKSILLFCALILASYSLITTFDTKTKWTITQHGWWDGPQLTFYTISSDDYLIVIDGGWRDTADKVREVITQYGGVVDIWIITHPHLDHVGAFLEIYTNPGPLQINSVYYGNFADIEAVIRSDDVIEEFHDFEELLIQTSFNRLYTGDEFTFSGLTFDVISTYGSHVYNMPRVLNNGSLMFMLRGRENTMLFCADVSNPMEKWLIDNIGEKLRADFIQLGHHGNGSSTLGSEFLTLVNPKVAFFDAPQWLFDDPDGTFRMEWIRNFMEDNGIAYYNFMTAPNSISFY